MSENAQELTVHAWLDALASDAPAPGGGAAAALCGALSSALVSMVARFALKHPANEDFAAQARATIEASESLRAELEGLVAADAAAFEAVAAAYQLPKSSEEDRAERSAAIQRALVVATDVPLQIARAAFDVIALAGTVAEIGPRSLVSDAGAAAVLAQGAARAALLNVDANLATMKGLDQREHYVSKISSIKLGLDNIVDRILALVALRQSHS